MSGVADMEAAESIPVGALAKVLQRKAPVTHSASHCAAASCEAAERPQASNTVYSLFAELREVFYEGPTSCRLSFFFRARTDLATNPLVFWLQLRQSATTIEFGVCAGGRRRA